MMQKSACYIKKILILFVLIFAVHVQSLLAAEKYYWENPKIITSGDSRFPDVINAQDSSYVFWQEIDSSKNQIWLSCRVYTNNTAYFDNLRFAGPFKFSGEVPDIFSVTAGKPDTATKDCVLVTVLSDKKNVSAYLSTNACRSFTKTDISSDQYFIAPRVYSCVDGSFRLFASVAINDSFYIYTAESKDGKKWSAFKQFDPCRQMRNPFVPYQISIAGGDLVVFQAYYSSSVTNRLSYQLFSTFTTDGQSWTEPTLLTDQSSLPSNEKRNFANFQNQRPSLYTFEGDTYLVLRFKPCTVFYDFIIVY